MPRGRGNKRVSASGLEGQAAAPPSFRANPDDLGSGQMANELQAQGRQLTGGGQVEPQGAGGTPEVQDVFAPGSGRRAQSPAGRQPIDVASLTNEPNLLLQALYEVYPHPDILYLMKRATRG